MSSEAITFEHLKVFVPIYLAAWVLLFVFGRVASHLDPDKRVTHNTNLPPEYPRPNTPPLGQGSCGCKQICDSDGKLCAIVHDHPPKFEEESSDGN